MAQKQGKLPKDFPGFSALALADIHTYNQLRNAGDVTEITGIGDITAGNIAEALKAADDAADDASENTEIEVGIGDWIRLRVDGNIRTGAVTDVLEDGSVDAHVFPGGPSGQPIDAGFHNVRAPYFVTGLRHADTPELKEGVPVFVLVGEDEDAL